MCLEVPPKDGVTSIIGFLSGRSRPLFRPRQAAELSVDDNVSKQWYTNPSKPPSSLAKVSIGRFPGILSGQWNARALIISKSSEPAGR